jgi:hypothetical protein
MGAVSYQEDAEAVTTGTPLATTPVPTTSTFSTVAAADILVFVKMTVALITAVTTCATITSRTTLTAVPSEKYATFENR